MTLTITRLSKSGMRLVSQRFRAFHFLALYIDASYRTDHDFSRVSKVPAWLLAKQLDKKLEA